MDWLLNAVQWVLNLGVSVMLPIIIFLLGLVMGAGFKKAFRSGITIGVGFIGINLVIGVLTGELAPAAKAMTERFGLNLSVIDVGWPAMSTITWAWSASALVFPVCIVINIIMLTFKWTKTMNVDLWNYWQFAFVGAAVQFLTGSLPLALAAAGLISAVALVMGDYTAPLVDKYFKMPGVSFPHLTALGYLPIVLPLNWLLDKIPGINKLYADPDTIRKRFGLFGEPMMMGLIIGFAIGLLAGQTADAVLKLGMSMAAVMFLMPKMVAVLMEGLIPISEAARDLMNKRFKGREIYIGLDAAVSLGEPSVIAVGLLMVPITIFLAFIVPGNRVLPFADLAVIPFIVCLITAFSKGNVIRTLMISTVVMAIVLVLATDLTPIDTQLAINAGVEFPAGATEISNLDRSNFITWIFIRGFGLLGGGN